MANELSIAAQLNFNKNGAVIAAARSGTFDVTGDHYESKVLEIGTVDESINKGDMSDVGFVLLKNLDTTNFVSAGDDGTNYPIKILPEEFAMFRLDGNTLHLIADTAACDVEIVMIEP